MKQRHHFLTTILKRSGFRTILMGFIVVFSVLSVDTAPAACSESEPISVRPNIRQLLSSLDGHIIVLTTDKKMMFRSTDAGTKWEQPTNLPDAFLYSISTDADGIFFLTTSAGVFCSNDSGLNWHQVSNLKVAFITFSADGALCLFKVWGKGLFRASPLCFSTKKFQETERTEQKRKDLADKAKRTLAELMKLKELPDNSPDKMQLVQKYSEWQSLKDQTAQLDKSVEEDLIAVQGLPDAPVQTAVFGSQDEAFAGFFGNGVYQSDDRGQTWQEANNGLLNRNILSFGLSPEGTVYAGTYGGGLFRWSRQNRAWSGVNTGLSEGIVQCLAFAPHGPITVGTRGEGVIFSQNGGQSWNLSEGVLNKANIHGIAVASDGTFYAGSYDRGLYVSRDEGRTWLPRPFANLSCVEKLATGENETWYAVIKGAGLLRIIEGGRSRTSVDLPFPYTETLSIAVGRHNRLFVGSPKAGVYVSGDGGYNWEKVMTGLAAEGVQALRSNDQGDLFAASSDGKGLFRLSADNVWQKIIASDQYGHDYSCWDIMFLPDAVGVAYGIQDLLISDNRLSSWRRERFGQNYRDLWIDSDGRLWTERFLSSFMRTEDGQWQERGDIPEDRYTFFSRLDDNRFAAIRMGGGLDIVRWTGTRIEQPRRTLEGRQVLALTVDGNRNILAGTEHGLWVSIDLGKTWREIDLQH